MARKKPLLHSDRAEEERSELHEFTSFPLLLLSNQRGFISTQGFSYVFQLLNFVKDDCYIPRAQVSGFHSYFVHRPPRDAAPACARPSEYKGIPW